MIARRMKGPGDRSLGIQMNPRVYLAIKMHAGAVAFASSFSRNRFHGGARGHLCALLNSALKTDTAIPESSSLSLGERNKNFKPFNCV